MAEAPERTLDAAALAGDAVGGDLHKLPPAHARALAARTVLRAQPALALATTADPQHLRAHVLAVHAAAHAALLAALGEEVPRDAVLRVFQLLEMELPATGWPPPAQADAVLAGAAAAASVLVGDNDVYHWLDVALASAIGTTEDTPNIPAPIPRRFAMAAAAEDYQALTTAGEPPPVAAFIGRPLWDGGLRSIVEPALAEWRRRLQDMLLPDLVDDYVPLLEGKPPNPEALRRALDRTLQQAGFAPAPPPGPAPQAAPAPQAVEGAARAQVSLGGESNANIAQQQAPGSGSTEYPPNIAQQQVSAPVGVREDAAAPTPPAAQEKAAQVEAGSQPARPPTPPAAVPPELRVPLSMLSDEALGDDSADALDFRPYADALAGLITDPTTATPLTLAINAQWGAGKTTLARLVEKRLRGGAGDRSGLPHITCWFNAWAHDDAEDLTGAFVATVAQAAAGERPRWRRWLRPVPSALLPPEERVRRRAWRITLLVVALLAAAALAVSLGLVTTKLVPKEVREALPSTALALVVLVLILAQFGLEQGLKFAGTVRDFVLDPASVAATGSVTAVRRQLERLIDQASRGDRRLVIFIDDLERCRPPRPVELLEVVNQLLGHKNVVTIVLADMPALAACVEIKYKELAERYRPSGTGLSAAGAGQDSPYLRAYGRLYLQKIVQLQFDIPPHAPQRIQALVQRLVATRVVPAATAPVAPAPATSTDTGAPAAGEALRAITSLVDPGRRARDARAYREQAAAAVQQSPAADVEQVLRAAPAPAGLQPETMRNIAREEVQRALVQPRSDIWNDAEGEALKHLPLLPRNAKRLINRLRLLIFIAQERRLFVTDRKGTAERIGKWGVLCERWPELANDAAQLEEYARLGKRQDFNSRVARQSPYIGDDELWEFCRGDPELRPILSSLLHMEVDSAAKAGAAPPAGSML